MIERSVAALATGAAFLVSLVEVAEAFIIMLVVATSRGRKSAVPGTGAALATAAAGVERDAALASIPKTLSERALRLAYFARWPCCTANPN